MPEVLILLFSMQTNESRTTHLTRNVAVTLFSQIILLLFAFINRTIFIKLLGEEYLGLDGLFSSILMIFSLAELGIGNALIFSLYKPIAANDTYRAQQYLTLYKKAYDCIIICILIIGICLLPFLGKIVNDSSGELNVNIYIIYILFLLNTISSYFLAYRQAVLIVNQRQSIVSVYLTTTKIIVYIFECLSLLFFASYYLYLFIRVIGNYLFAISVSRKAKNTFPSLCISNNEPLSAEDVARLKRDVFALFIRRVGGVVLASTDNIIINKYISLAMVGVYSNYVLIVTSVQSVATQLMSAMTATIGNFVATQSKEDTGGALKLYSFITYLLYGYCSIFLISLVNKFIIILWGEQYVLSKFALYLIVVNFFFYGFQSAINVFRDTTGLFTQGKYRTFTSALVNVITSIILVKFYGIEGVIMGTIISRLLVSVWYDPYIIYSKFLNKTSKYFFIRFACYLITTLLTAFAFDYLTSYFPNTLGGFIFSAILLLFSIIFLTIPYCKTFEFNNLFYRVKLICVQFKAK